ncbi:MAG: DUF389 domain-containing protein [Actinomycetota bacterium]|nr:DUF389 domain-containing protein [Actinomycetota bacterium]
MLRLRLSVPSHRAGEVAESLLRHGGVRRPVSTPSARSGEEVVLSADVMPSAADEVMSILQELEVPADDYMLTRLEVIAPSGVRSGGATATDGFAWVAVMGEARANSRPLARYLALMAVAGVIAAIGVIKSNAILVVGAMAVSPDLLPICSACVAIVARRRPLAIRALGTLLVGLGLVATVAAAVTGFLDLTGLLDGQPDVDQELLSSLTDIDYSTILVALAAGIAAMLAFETRASAAVGVAISVTTIPASAFLGVAIALGEHSNAGGAAVVLATNVLLLLFSGSLTLALQRWAMRTRLGR